MQDAFRALDVTLIIAVKSSRDHWSDQVRRCLASGLYREVIVAIKGRPRAPLRRGDLVVLKGRDEGIYAAWNAALQLASGRYVTFLGLGDEHRFEPRHGRIEPADVVFPYLRGGAHRFVHSGALFRRELLLRFPFDPAYRILGDLRQYQQLTRAGVSRSWGGFATSMAPGGLSWYLNRRLVREYLRVAREFPAATPYVAFRIVYLLLRHNLPRGIAQALRSWRSA